MSTRLRLRLVDQAGDARLNTAVVEELLGSLEDVNQATCITLEGNDAAFCDGMDLGVLLGPDADAQAALDRFAALLRAIETAPCPVVALVRGRALGGGVGLAAAADIVLATPDATFGLPEALFGLVPAVVFPVITRRIGLARARALAIGARAISAADACRIGLVDEVTDELEVGLAPYLRRFERLDARAVGEVKALAAALYETPATYHAESTRRFHALLESQTARERITRFLAGDVPWPDVEEP